MARKYTIPYFGIIVILAWVIVGFAMVAASAADEDPPNDPPVRATRFQPSQRIWQCNDIRVTETVNQPGIVNYDLGGTIWGGSQFTLDIRPNGGGLWFNGRPCYRWR